MGLQDVRGHLSLGGIAPGPSRGRPRPAREAQPEHHDEPVAELVEEPPLLRPPERQDDVVQLAQPRPGEARRPAPAAAVTSAHRSPSAGGVGPLTGARGRGRARVERIVAASRRRIARARAAIHRAFSSSVILVMVIPRLSWCGAGQPAAAARRPEISRLASADETLPASRPCSASSSPGSTPRDRATAPSARSWRGVAGRRGGPEVRSLSGRSSRVIVGAGGAGTGRVGRPHPGVELLGGVAQEAGLELQLDAADCADGPEGGLADLARDAHAQLQGHGPSFVQR